MYSILVVTCKLPTVNTSIFPDVLIIELTFNNPTFKFDIVELVTNSLLITTFENELVFPTKLFIVAFALFKLLVIKELVVILFDIILPTVNNKIDAFVILTFKDDKLNILELLIVALLVF